MQGLDTESGNIPELPDLFTWTDDGVRLVSAKCNSCGTYFFPASHHQHRPGCSREGMEDVLLSKRGKLATYTVQHYMCPPPFNATDDFAPYGVAMVDLPEGISVAGIVVDSDLDTLEIGQEMETTACALRQDDEGRNVCTWAFRRVG